jgi:hypothetical protein
MMPPISSHNSLPCPFLTFLPLTLPWQCDVIYLGFTGWAARYDPVEVYGVGDIVMAMAVRGKAGLARVQMLDIGCAIELGLLMDGKRRTDTLRGGTWCWPWRECTSKLRGHCCSEDSRRSEPFVCSRQLDGRFKASCFRKECGEMISVVQRDSDGDAGRQGRGEGIHDCGVWSCRGQLPPRKNHKHNARVETTTTVEQRRLKTERKRRCMKINSDRLASSAWSAQRNSLTHESDGCTNTT